MNEFTKEELMLALLDLTEGKNEWWIYQEDTGLSDERCKEIELIVSKCKMAKSGFSV